MFSITREWETVVEVFCSCKLTVLLLLGSLGKQCALGCSNPAKIFCFAGCYDPCLWTADFGAERVVRSSLVILACALAGVITYDFVTT